MIEFFFWDFFLYHNALLIITPHLFKKISCERSHNIISRVIEFIRIRFFPNLGILEFGAPDDEPYSRRHLYALGHRSASTLYRRRGRTIPDQDARALLNAGEAGIEHIFGAETEP